MALLPTLSIYLQCTYITYTCYMMTLFLREMKWALRVITLRLLYDTSYDNRLSQEDASTITPTALKRMLVQQQCPKTIIAFDLTAQPSQNFSPFGLFTRFAEQTIPNSSLHNFVNLLDIYYWTFLYSWIFLLF